MQHVKLYVDLAGIGIRLRYLESCCLGRPIYGNQSVEEVQRCVVFLDVFHQGGNVVLHTKQHSASVHKLDVDILADTSAEPSISRQIHRFLWRTCAFDWHWRLCKNRPAPRHLLHQLPSIWGKIVAVVRCDAIAPQGFFEAFNLPPIELKARTDDEAAIFHHPAPIQDDRIVLGFKGGNCGLDPRHIAGNEAAHGFGGLARTENSSAHHRPTGLIVMDICGINHCNREI